MIKENSNMETRVVHPTVLQKKTRIEYIDLLRCFAIYMVCWMHSFGYRAEYVFVNDQVWKFIAAVNMPLFFMISGFLFSSSFDLSSKDFFRKKFTTLIIPHIVWILIVGLSDWVIPLVGWTRPFRGGSVTVLSQIKAFFTPDPAANFWFLKVLFLTESIVFIFYKIFKKRYVALIGSMLFVLLFSFFGVVSKLERFLMPVFLVGILLKQYYSSFSKHLNKILISAGLLFLVCFYVYKSAWTFYVMDFPPLFNFRQSFTEGKLVFDFTNIGISVFRSLTGIVGSIFFFALFQKCWKKNTVTAFFSHCGQITLGIYAVQSIIHQRILRNLVLLNIVAYPKLNIWVFSLITSQIIGVFVLLVCVLIVSLIQRNKRLTFILFGSSLIDQRFIFSENQCHPDDHVKVSKCEA
ncbi:MAG: acyltransferase [Treponema sp.]|jgi:fucose 4-O-acetylase-like acetyltransferase|nr:acyltransferase [Treponema sp.]